MASYAAFGVHIDCDFELPELEETRRSISPTWRVETRSNPAPTTDGEVIGVDTVYGSVQVRAFATADSIRLVFDDTGTFDVRAAERLIAWYPGRERNEAAIRADLLGRVMALAAHSSGHLALHASAVTVDGRAIAFLGPKFAGKSTLALALVRRGGRLLTDDTLVVRVDSRGQPCAAPGVHRIRLWDDSARALRVGSRGATGEKPTADALPQDQLERSDVPLDACYVVRPASTNASDVGRERLSPVRAAVACVSFTKLGSLAGGSQSAVVLDRCATLTGAVPFFVATVPRDLDRLDEIAATFLGWHDCPRPNAATG